MRPAPGTSTAGDAQEQQQRFRNGYDSWMAQQEADVLELRTVLSSPDARRDEPLLRSLIDKHVQRCQEYIGLRRQAMREDVLSFFCPAWCTSLENSFLWMAGCRPTMQIRILYHLSGTQLESRLEEYLRGDRCGDLGELRAPQLERVNELHCRTIQGEDSISRCMTLLQEDIADSPLVPLAMRIKEKEAREREHAGFRGNNVDDPARTRHLAEINEAVEPYLCSLAEIMEEADKLRMSTMKELLLDILTPIQAVELIAAGKQLHLSIHQCGIHRDKVAAGTPAPDPQ